MCARCGAAMKLANSHPAPPAPHPPTHPPTHTQASYEEEFLVERYGDDYRQYKASGVKKLLPYIY